MVSTDSNSWTSRTAPLCKTSVLLFLSTWCLCTVFVYIVLATMRPRQIEIVHGPFVEYDDDDDEDNLLDYYMAFGVGQYAGVENYTKYTTARLGLHPLPNVRPIRADIGAVINDVTSFQYLVNIQQTCSTKNDADNLNSVFVVVVSAPSYFEKRDAIRRTWMQNLMDKTVRDLVNVAGFAFLVGLTDIENIQADIEKENRKHGDIIQVDILDTYNNLTLKSVSILNWVIKFCPQVNFVAKVDDDVYVNVRNLAATIRALSTSDSSIYGKGTGGNIPSRIEGRNSSIANYIELTLNCWTGKWGYSYKVWPWSHLPKYIDGPFYLISGNAVAPLLAAAQTTPFFISEDVYLSGLCSRKVGVSIRSSTKYYLKQPERTLNLIDNLTRLLVSFRMLVHDGWPVVPNPCFVRQTISWLTDGSVYQMNGSHYVTEQFYANLSHCLMEIVASDSVQRITADPKNLTVASFNLVSNPDLVA